MSEEPLVWFVIEWSRVGANDWFNTTHSCDSIERARQLLFEVAQLSKFEKAFEHRIVKKTLTSEIVS